MRNKKKLIVGLTGGFGSGKSTVCMLFKEFGAKIFDCDKAAHQSLEKNTATYRKIVKSFGRKILSKSGRIDRKKLGEIVFQNKKQKRELEKIVHPFVFKKIKGFIERKNGILIIEVPLLFEAKMERMFDFIVVVSCSQKKAINRIIKRMPHLSAAEVKRRIQFQMSLAAKKKKADIIIDNSEIKKVVRQVREIVNYFNSVLINER